MEIITDLVTHVKTLIASGEKLLSDLRSHQSITQAEIHAPQASAIQDLHDAAKATATEAEAHLDGQVEPANPTSTFQERVIAEKEDLDAKGSALHRFLNTPTFAGLDQLEQNRLSEQADIMAKYSIVLGQRIAAFSAPSLPEITGDAAVAAPAESEGNQSPITGFNPTPVDPASLEAASPDPAKMLTPSPAPLNPPTQEQISAMPVVSPTQPTN